jgi:hypothetical protein
MSKQKQIINRLKTLVKEYKSLNEAMLTITKQDMDRLHSGEEVDIDGTQLKFVDESVNEVNKDNIPYTYKNQEEVDYLDSKGKIGSGTVVGVAKDYYWILPAYKKQKIKVKAEKVGLNIWESVNESWVDDYGKAVQKARGGYQTRMSSGNYSVIIGKTLDGFFGTLLVNTRGGKMGTATGIRYNNKSRDKVIKWAEKELKKVSKEPIVNESVNEAKYNYKQDAMNAYMKGEITAKELDKISKEDFKSSVATKKELQNFLNSGYMKSLMANTYGLEVPAMEKKVKELMRFAESVNEDEQLDEKLITFSNRAPYGQVVFMAGGAGSGKGFAISNFIDSAGFKVRDVDEMKKQVGKLEQIGKINIDSWYKKYSGNLSPDAREHVEKYVINKGLSISDIAGDLRNPNNVASLHFIVDAMGIKEKWLINMLSGKNNPETLPNLIFDITAKNIKSITKTIPTLISQGYKPQNIHLIWVLTNYHIAVKQNKSRARIVPDDIMLLSHEGAAKTIWSIVNGALPRGLNGRIDVILGGAKNTVMYTDSNGNELKGAVKGFTTLPVKKQGGGILPEKQWLDILYKWVSDNAPKTISLQKPLDLQMESLKEYKSLNESELKKGK